MKYNLLFPAFLLFSTIVSAQKNTLSVEAQLYTLGDVTFQTNGNEKGLSATSVGTTKSVLTQWEGETGIKILTLKTAIGKAIPPLTLNVPSQYNTYFQAVQGNISLQSLKGYIEGNTSKGNIVVNRVDANVRLSTQKGNIDVENSRVNGDISTQSGDINLTDVDGEFSLIATSGHIFANFTASFFVSRHNDIFSFGFSKGNIKATSSNGGVSLKVAEGDITILKTNSVVEAVVATQGDIRLENISGFIRATTAKGSVYVQALPDIATDTQPIWIEANEGDVTLIVPKALAGYVAIDVSQTSNLSQKFVIESVIGDGNKALEDIKTSDGKLIGRSYRSRQLLGTATTRNIVIKVRNGNLYIKTL